MARPLDNDNQRPDVNRSLFESLPENAKLFYSESNIRGSDNYVYVLSASEIFLRNINALRIYPLLKLRYLNANQLCPAIVNGEHRIYRGPGFHFVTGITDQIFPTVEIGTDIFFGPIKVVYVEPGSLRFASYRDTGRPLLLGPGMHHFNDVNLVVGSKISMNFSGQNQVIRCDTLGAFQFVFVKAGSAAIVILRDGNLSVFEPGLHFIQAPDALKTFVSVQQEHFTFGTCDNGQCFLTADNVELHINATIFYRVVDVVTLFTTRIKDEKDLLDVLHSQAMSTLLTIIRSETFQGIGNRRQIQRMNTQLQKSFIGTDISEIHHSTSVPLVMAETVPNNLTSPSNNEPSAPAKADDVLESITMGFQNIIHDAEPQFQRMMQINFGSSGIEIQSLRIEQIEFADKSMQKQVSEFAMTNTQLLSKQQTITAQRTLQVAEAERDAATLLIKKKAEIDSKIMQTDAENTIKIKTARADAENKLIIAEAEAQAILKIGEADLAIMERQNAMPNAALRIFTEAQKEVLAGVSKVIYTDQQSLLMKPFYNYNDLDNAFAVSGGNTGNSGNSTSGNNDSKRVK